MADKDDNTPDSLENSLNGEFPLQEQDENGLNTSTASSGSEHEQLKKQRTQSPSPQRGPLPFMVAASPPKFVSLEKLMAATNGVKDMALAHEIAVDNNFELEKMELPENSIEKQVKEVVHKAFWDAFQEKLNEDPPDYGHAVVLIAEVKEKLLSLLLPQHVRFRVQIEEVLDTELIQQKLQNDTFDIFYYSNYIIGVMAKLCAPVRDEAVAELREIKEVIPLFNDRFIENGYGKLHNTTDEAVHSTTCRLGIDGLEFTKQWLKRSFEKLSDITEPSATEGASSSSMGSPASILNEAYVELLNWDDNQIFPETLVIDQNRILEMRDKTRKLMIVASVLLLTYSTVGEPIAGVQQLKEQMKTETLTILDGVHDKDLSLTMTNVAEQINKSVNTFMKSHGFTERDLEQQKVLIGQIKEVANKDNTVNRLMGKRLSDFIKQILSSQHKEPMKVPPGFSVVESELSKLSGQFLRLISHNRAVFGIHYADIINTLLHRQMEDLSPRG
ncbi:hypothetical protein KUTeg_007579 [Tegillarca granosa]|uniref:T-complex protein 11-like protein 1 n=1 Tax=Tegillarca granosa TaxID=220873 RepID=A0ABQ9FDM7_TEGGR|nr:hypothetical protein KUTeg_007579 [Tegillarca granosa]